MPITTLPDIAEFEGPKALKPGRSAIPDADKTYGMRVGATNAFLGRLIELFADHGKSDGTTSNSLWARVLGLAAGILETADVQTISGATTVNATARFVYVTGTTYTVQLPALASITKRRTIVMVFSTSGNITLARNGASQINDGSSDYVVVPPGFSATTFGARIAIVHLDPGGFHYVSQAASLDELRGALTPTSVTATGLITSDNIRRGAGSPEGVVTANQDTLYFDTTNHRLYLKVAGVGNTGWREMSPSESGTYTPTYTVVTNLDSVVSDGLVHYIRVGNEVSVTGKCTVDPTASGTIVFGVSLPIASNLAAVSDARGLCIGAQSFTGNASADATNDRAEFTIGNNITTSFGVWFHFAYRVL